MIRMAATGEASEGGETWTLPDGYRLMLWVTMALRTAQFGWICVTAYNFFSRRSQAPRMLIILYGASIELNMVEGAWERRSPTGMEPTRRRRSPGLLASRFWRRFGRFTYGGHRR